VNKVKMNEGDATVQGRPPPPASSSSNTMSRISSVSDITDFGTYDGDYHDESLSRGDLLVSAQSANDAVRRQISSPELQPTSNDASRWPLNRAGSNRSRGYEPVSNGTASPPSRKNSRFGHVLSIRRAPEAIQEESTELSLLEGAADMGTAEQVPLASSVKDLASPVVEMPSLGPMTRHDEEFMKKLQEEEASGKLTGGLGSGLKTEKVMSESQLLATSPTTDRSMARSLSTSLSRSLTRSITRRQPRPGRAQSLRQLGQDEANKSGEVIEVIMEDPSEVDIGYMSGPSLPNSDDAGPRRSTFPAKAAKSQVFYPQPDWKPFSMKWPYLMFLIVLSLSLAGAMEIIYQASTREPLLTFNRPSDIPGGQYFAFKFLPTIVTVTFGVLWQITDFEVKRLEAFYQLSKQDGALAAVSINVDYITNFNFLRPLRAVQYRHYAVAVSSVASLLAVSVVPTLGTACIILQPDRNQRQADPDGEKWIVVQPVLSRILTIVLVIIAFLGCILFYQLQSRKSGLVGDVKGVAGLASMAVVSHILTDFKDMDLAKHREIHNGLKDHRYMLRNASLAPAEAEAKSRHERDTTKSHLSENPHPLMLRPAGSLSFILAISTFLALIPVFLFTPATLLTDKAPWVVTFIAVCIKLSWGSLETDVRMMEPFYILSRRHAPPKTLTLDYTAMPFGWVAYQAVRNGHYLVFWVAFGTIFTEILTVLTTSLAAVEGRDFIVSNLLAGNATAAPGGALNDIDSGQETSLSFWLTLGLAVTILLYMGIVASVVFFRRHHPFLPRQPNTIASVLAFIHQSKMLYDFVGTAKYSNAEMIEKLNGLRKDGKPKTYGLGWFEGRDGQTHCGVDEEELRSNYRHGEDYSQSNRPWIDNQTDWL
jgi:hypothetical protein